MSVGLELGRWTNKLLYQAIKLANTSSEFKYTEVMSMLSDSYYYSDLGSQRIVSICTILGLITNVRYLTYTTIAKGKKLLEVTLFKHDKSERENTNIENFPTGSKIRKQL